MNCFKKNLIKKLLTTVVIIGVLTTALFYFRWDIAALAQKTQQARQEAARRSTETNSFTQLQNQAVIAESYTSVLENALPNRDQLFNFQREMERLAVEKQIGFNFTFSNETPSTVSQAGRINFLITAEGSLKTILQFIEDAEKSRFLLNFKNFEFNDKSGKISGETFFK